MLTFVAFITSALIVSHCEKEIKFVLVCVYCTRS